MSHTDAELLDTAVALACERRSDPTREELDYLLDRSREHDRRLAQIDERLDQSAEDVADGLRAHAEQLTELCDKWAFVSDSLTRQAREIERLSAGLKARDAMVAAPQARGSTAAAPKQAGVRTWISGPAIPDGPGRLLYWFFCGVAFASLVGGVALMTKFLNAPSVTAERSFLPLELIGVSIVAALLTLVIGRMLGRPPSDAVESVTTAD